MYTTSAPVSPNLTIESRSSRVERRRPVLLYSTTSTETVGSLSTCVLYDSQITVNRSSRVERRRPVLLYSTTSTEMVGSLSACVMYF